MEMVDKVTEILRNLKDNSVTVADIVNYDVKDGKDNDIAYMDTYWGAIENKMKSYSTEKHPNGWNLPDDLNRIYKATSCKPTALQKMCVFQASEKKGVDCDVALRLRAEVEKVHLPRVPQRGLMSPEDCR